MTDIYYNEKFVGTCKDAQAFLQQLKKERREARLPNTVNFYYDENAQEIQIDSSKGRPRRPLIIVENGKSRLTEEHLKKLHANELSWNDLLAQGIIEYVDAAEEENTYIAIAPDQITKEHTHLEISPTVILGIITSLVPYANFGQSSRLNRGSKTQKQALGMYALNYHLRLDTDVNVLHYPQAPLVRSFMHDLVDYSNHPSGQNVTIAVMSYKGYNMSDGIILNKGSVQRGLGRSTFYRPYIAEELRYSGGLMDEISVPNADVKGFKSQHDYRLLEDDGIISPELPVTDEDVIIGKSSPPRFLGELEEFNIAANVRRESSVTIKHGEQGIIDFIVITENEEGNKLVKIRLRDQRIPEVGDKFASRHGQKGVIGAVIPEEDMPFSASGLRPDLIFSPHSIPSRMTISHLIEIIAGKTGALSGQYIDGTTFSATPEADLRKTLHEMGFRENGTERMYNGITGEEFDVNIYIGNMYYLRLKHMVANKLHARASGRIQLLTRQPIEGRSKGGGLRLGEMEKDCFVAHGASLLLKERFDSDKTIVHIAEPYGTMAIDDISPGKKFSAKLGHSNVEVTPIEISYAFKLLLDELKSLGIHPKLKLKSKYTE